MPQMKPTWGLAGVLGLAMAATLPAAAQEVDRIDRVAGVPSPGGMGRAPDGVKVVAPGALVFASFDRNGDGRVTIAEIEAGAEVSFVAGDRNGDGVITGFEQTDWAVAMGSALDVMSNAMTFDIDLDRAVTRAEFVAGLKRIAGQIQPNGDLTFADLLQPLTRPSEGDQGQGFGFGRIIPRGSPPAGTTPNESRNVTTER
jgi:EF hand